MTESKVKILNNGPLVVESFVPVVDADGNEYEKSQYAALCRCGASQNKPFCDGGHNAAKFESAPRAGQ